MVTATKIIAIIYLQENSELITLSNMIQYSVFFVVCSFD